ncbi:uncharacterized protein KLLA0_B02376g [Kluyveromyces lactis]|uniref:KLLA0B02376p n=1 Tax=Kluyveromyces lactis (strain ATCC 8585 / CBS 2359 / DSM 70799 / NBRC 1267 / NRRL Y-1140 / WM37) TaxID=284590 RepID=Q6CWQ2_KLULA|nr:uncharacterized protein KLLA0_B02376g [Kluyveromyces lactis]CAH02030.1 KLLA0B02376p [Kluyveromyces lactis]|eukprot:XP_451637.1 uncharacterized protein KLLA0_B02376g [Kluyveromyces lactis]
MSVISDSSVALFNKIPSGAVLSGVVLCYLLSGGRVSISLALIISFFILKKHSLEVSESGDELENETPKKKKGCCGGKNGGCSSKKLDEFGMPVKKNKGCCGGACKSKKAQDPAPVVEVGYDNEIDFTDSFKN